ncbi:MAG: hypothetical protein GTO14_05770 [Anaerolineales bacterium]|nr:hypothetical protein [Anaerolineales bacterium]
MYTKSPVASRVEKWLDRLFDEEPASLNECRTFVLFHMFLPEIMSSYGLGLDGYVFRQRNSDVTLTVKVHEGDTPLVAFTTSADTTGCMMVFLRSLEGSRIRWIRDKYPWF